MTKNLMKNLILSVLVKSQSTVDIPDGTMRAYIQPGSLKPIDVITWFSWKGRWTPFFFGRMGYRRLLARTAQASRGRYWRLSGNILIEFHVKLEDDRRLKGSSFAATEMNQE